MPLVPKYRVLTSDELEELKNEFIQFLIVNGVTADDWVRLKEEETDRAEDLITLFSDVVMKDVLAKVKFLEHHSSGEVRAFQCLTDRLVLVAMEAQNPGIDLTDKEFIAKSARSAPSGLRIYTTEKYYQKEREAELYALIESGCAISDGRLFKTLALGL